jgi:hypothetical protein
MPSNSSDLKLTPTQQAAFVVLMAQARELSNKDLQDLAGFTLTGTDKKRLNDLDLVKTRKGKGGLLFHELTDAGWRFCNDELADQRPKTLGPGGRALPILLEGLRRALASHQLTLGELFAEEPAPVSTQAGGAGEAPAPGASNGSLESLVRSAYKQLARAPGAYVSLADLRDALPAVDHRELDETLIQMDLSPRVHLVPVANQGSLTARERDAAVWMGGESQHALQIEDA